MVNFEEEKEKLFEVIENSGEEKKALTEEIETTVKEKEELHIEMEASIKMLKSERDDLLLKLNNVGINIEEDKEKVTDEVTQKLKSEKDELESERDNLVELLKEREDELLKSNDFVKKMSTQMEEILEGEVGKPLEALTKECEQLKSENKALIESQGKIEKVKNQLEAELNSRGSPENAEDIEAREEELVLLKLEVEELQEKLSEEDREVTEKLAGMEQLRQQNTELLLKVHGNEEQTQLSLMDKLSATLNTIDESFFSARDEMEETLKSPGIDFNLTANPMNQTMVPMEVVEAIKAQLLALQDQLIAFNPEQLKNSQIQVEELKKELQLSEEKAKEVSIKVEKDLKQKHKTEISIITNKMREEINFNMPALEEKIREEVVTKKKLTSTCQRWRKKS